MPSRNALPAAAVAVTALLAPPFAAAQAAPSAATPQAVPVAECEVVARVNTEVILACELEWQVRLMFQQRFGDSADTALESPLFASAREQLMQNLVLGQLEIALLYADFRSNAPHADFDAIHRQLQTPFDEREVPRLMEVVGVEERDALESRLLELGTSLGERRQDFFRTMIARSWLTESITFDEEISHQQMLDYYRENPEEFDQPKSARWEELMVRFDRHPSKEAAWAALAQLGNTAAGVGAAPGEPAFAELAPGRSHGFTAEEGGAHDWTAPGTLASEQLEESLFNLPVGEMSPILEGPLGFHIVRVLERREAGPQPFSEVQADIRKKLRDERFNAAVSAILETL